MKDEQTRISVKYSLATVRKDDRRKMTKKLQREKREKNIVVSEYVFKLCLLFYDIILTRLVLAHGTIDF